jgi:core-2/I-Branching enzyme
MRIAYLLLAHNNPQLLNRLVRALSSEECTFFIHIDKKTSIEQFSGIGGENVFFSNMRIPVYWAEFSQFQAILLLLRQALESPQDFQYFVLLSGSDFPLRSPAYIQKFLEVNHGLEFMSLMKIPGPGKPISRINTLVFPSDKPVRRFAARVLRRIGLAQRDYRKYLGSLELYAGSTWWALTRDACQYISAFLHNNRHVETYFQNVFVPDEAIFHTVLGNSEFRSRVRRNLLYEDWSAEDAHPAPISDHHLAFFESQDKVCADDLYGQGECLFARKFSDAHVDLVQRILDMIRRKERAESTLEVSAPQR